jgi:hypothetical protein
MRARWLIALGLVLVGLVWIAQGTGLLGGAGTGFMNGSTFWAAVGAVLVVAGGVVAWTAFRARPRV